jgi:hypothetical protein
MVQEYLAVFLESFDELDPRELRCSVRLILVGGIAKIAASKVVDTSGGKGSQEKGHKVEF